MKRVSIVILTFLITACGSQSNTAPPPTQTQTTAASATPEASRTEQRITIDSADGVRLVGSYFVSPKPNSPGLLLLHQWQSDRHSYDDLAKQLQARGFAVLSIDGRGFGESTKKADGTSVAAGRSDADVKAMLGDVDAAVTFLQKQPNVDPKRVGIIGASYGSSLAIIYAADHSDITAVALLSPGLNYFGNMPTEPAVRKFSDRQNRNLFFIAAEDDKESADAVKKLDPIEVDSYRYPRKIFESGGHGTALLKVGAGDAVSEFFAGVMDLANLHIKQ